MTRYHGQQYIYLFILIIVLGFTGWYYAQPSLSTPRLSEETLAHLPDVVITNVHATQFNNEGMLSSRFYTPELIHFPYNNMSQFVAPRIIIYSDQKADQVAPWYIQADKGQSEQGSDQITLTQHVIMHQDASLTEKAKTITTEEIIYNAKTDRAFTDKMIYFDQTGLQVQSQGMEAYLKQQKVHLLQQVVGKYLQIDAEN